VTAGGVGARLSCVTWNVHRGRGRDGVVDPERTVDVLLGEVHRPGLHALCLQEADAEAPPHRGLLDIARIEAATGLRHVHGDPATRWGAASHGFLGVVLFLDAGFPIEDVALVDLPGHCHRGAVVADFTGPAGPVRLIGTHLALWQGLRTVQLRTIGQHLRRRAPRPTILCGDLNEWRPWGGLALSARVLGARFAGPVHATFPAFRPLLPLDRVLADGGASVRAARVLDGPGIRTASDHRPLAAEVAVEAGS